MLVKSFPELTSILMEAAYDNDLGDAFNQANDVASHNISSSWREGHDGEGDEGMALVVSIVVPIIFGFIVIVGFFGSCCLLSIFRGAVSYQSNLTGNALVVTVVLCNPQMRSTTNLLIINLAVADLLFIGT